MNFRGVAPNPTRFFKKAGQKLSKIALCEIFKRVFVELFSKSSQGAGQSPANLTHTAFSLYYSSKK